MGHVSDGYSLGEAKRNIELIDASKVRKCKTCGTLISFIQLKSGKWMAVDAHFDKKENSYFIYAHYGNNNNFTARHNCNEIIERREQAKLEIKKEEDMKKKAIEDHTLTDDKIEELVKLFKRNDISERTKELLLSFYKGYIGYDKALKAIGKTNKK